MAWGVVRGIALIRGLKFPMDFDFRCRSEAKSVDRYPVTLEAKKSPPSGGPKCELKTVKVECPHDRGFSVASVRCGVALNAYACAAGERAVHGELSGDGQRKTPPDNCRAGL